MRYHGLSWSRRMVSWSSFFLVLTASILALSNFPQDLKAWYGLILASFFLLLLGLGLRQVYQGYEYRFEDGKLFRKLGPWVKSYDLNLLVMLKNDPSRNTLKLKFNKNWVWISRRIRGFETLLTELENHKPHLFPTITQDQVLWASRSPHIFYSLFLVLLTGFYFILLPALGDSFVFLVIVQGFLAFLVVLILIRIVLILPLKYTLEKEGVKVRYLLRSKVFLAATAVKLVEDSYRADGAYFLVVKLVFIHSNLVLDEFNLKQSLKPFLPWIRQNYAPEVNSTF